MSVHEYLSVPGRIVLVRFKPGRVGSFVAQVQGRDFPYGHVTAVGKGYASSEFPVPSRWEVRSAERSRRAAPSFVQGGIAGRFVKVPISRQSSSAESGLQRRSGPGETSCGTESPNIRRIGFQYVHGRSGFLDGQRGDRIEKHSDRVSGSNDGLVDIIVPRRVRYVRSRSPSGFQECGKLREIAVPIYRIRHRHVRIGGIRGGLLRNSQAFCGVSTNESLVCDYFSRRGELYRFVGKRIRSVPNDRQLGPFLQKVQIRRSRGVPRIGGVSRERHEPHRGEDREHGDDDDEFREGERGERRFSRKTKHGLVTFI